MFVLALLPCRLPTTTVGRKDESPKTRGRALATERRHRDARPRGQAARRTWPAVARLRPRPASPVPRRCPDPTQTATRRLTSTPPPTPATASAANRRCHHTRRSGSASGSKKRTSSVSATSNRCRLPPTGVAAKRIWWLPPWRHRGREYTPTNRVSRISSPVSSRTSRTAASASDSPGSTAPPGRFHSPASSRNCKATWFFATTATTTPKPGISERPFQLLGGDGR
jgi:hypothetical protein